MTTATQEAKVITGDRYVVTDIRNGRVMVLVASGHCIPCKWHAEHQRLESVAVNADAATRVPPLYNLNASKTRQCLSMGWKLMTAEEVSKVADHI